MTRYDVQEAVKAPAGLEHVPDSVLFDEALGPPEPLASSLDLVRLGELRWLPLRFENGWAWIATSRDDTPAVAREAGEMLKAGHVEVSRANDTTITRFIEHAQDINPGFPRESGRTILARTRTFLASRRSQLASLRTLLAKGRTGLATLRTGLSLITVAMVVLKVFGLGLALIPEVVLVVCGTVMAVDGLLWYHPIRHLARRQPREPVGPSDHVTVPIAILDEGRIVVWRSPPVPNALELANDCDRLSPVMRRRFLALERTELALERTRQAYFRTIMAKSRTGMALVRTGIALAGVGMVFLRRLPGESADVMGIGLLLVGTVLILEGMTWYFTGRKSGRQSQYEAAQAGDKASAWSMLLPPSTPGLAGRRYRCVPMIRPGCSPGIWGTTGLALERTLLAERRNVMARFRTNHARSRTGLAFIRTAANFVAVGLGLLLTGPAGGIGWTVLDCFIIAVGLLLLADGFYWIIPAARERWQLPFCDCQMEITVPDYTVPAEQWRTFVLDDGNE